MLFTIMHLFLATTIIIQTSLILFGSAAASALEPKGRENALETAERKQYRELGRDDPVRRVHQYVHTKMDGVMRVMNETEIRRFSALWRGAYNQVHRPNPDYDIIIDFVTVDFQNIVPGMSIKNRNVRGRVGGGSNTAGGSVDGSCSRCKHDGIPPLFSLKGGIEQNLRTEFENELLSRMRNDPFEYFNGVTKCSVMYVPDPAPSSSMSLPEINTSYLMS